MIMGFCLSKSDKHVKLPTNSPKMDHIQGNPTEKQSDTSNGDQNQATALTHLLLKDDTDVTERTSFSTTDEQNKPNSKTSDPSIFVNLDSKQTFLESSTSETNVFSKSATSLSKSATSIESTKLKMKHMMDFADMGEVQLPEHRWSEACTDSLRKALCESQMIADQKNKTKKSSSAPKVKMIAKSEKIVLTTTDQEKGRSGRRKSILSSLDVKLVAIPETADEPDNPEEFEYSDIDVYF